jgi:hypothetical protein
MWSLELRRLDDEMIDHVQAHGEDREGGADIGFDI